jgi:glycosyltransferase involved in cell wall biosynthesis
MLDIVIPTFNREAKLSAALANLLPQLDIYSRLYLLDNASTDQTECIALQAQREYPDLSITYVRNSMNIGGNANILRAFEVGSAKWLWILGDDDAIRSNSVAVLQAAITRHSNALYIQFVSKLNQNSSDTEQIFDDLGSLFKSQSFSFSDFLFISSGIYNADRVRPYIRFGHHYQYTFAPHVCALLMSALEDPGDIILNPSQVIDWEPLVDSIWDFNFLNFSLLQVLNILPYRSLRRLLYVKIQEAHPIELKRSFSFDLNLICSPRKIIVDTIYVNLDIYRMTGFRGAEVIYSQMLYILSLLRVGSFVFFLLAIYRAFRKKKALALDSPLGSGLRKFSRL